MTTNQKRERLRKHLEGRTIVEVQALYMQSLPFPKDDMIETIVDIAAANGNTLDTMLASFEAETPASEERAL